MAHAGGPDLDAAEQGELPAGEFSAWLVGMQAALRGVGVGGWFASALFSAS